ncbi:uncharacterized protein TRIADDRAFT_57780 [Trichoplax adhaerens]|uniref:AAA+ ATPase domain-containing protein n=1 Tax=Trichoplax adhaerens TaxID=10228 RepID=B3S0E2_TRIAD|nr:predicted protein [Trichoplax adhaerens]EDV24364.1 predicted protein [Trichoplax adhaerens]|eukprot:XP_002113890.1 predicted protein [Trichoplax adhaerens]
MAILQNGSEESIYVYAIHSREGDQGRDEDIIETDFGLLQNMPPKSPLLLTHVTAEMEQCIKAITGRDKNKLGAVISYLELERVNNLSIKLSQESGKNLGTWLIVAVKVIMQEAEKMSNEELMAEIERKHREEIEIQYEDGLDTECGKPGYLVKIQFDNYRVKNLGKSFCWRNIPMLAVITGKNGSGKTAILEAILQGSKSKNFDITDLDTSLLASTQSMLTEFNHLNGIISMISRRRIRSNKSSVRPTLSYRRNVSQICYLSSNSEEKSFAPNSIHDQKGDNKNPTIKAVTRVSDDFEQNFNKTLEDITKRRILGERYQMECSNHEELYRKIIDKVCDATMKLGLTNTAEIESKLQEKLAQYLREEIGQLIKTYGSWKDYIRYFLQMDNTLYDVNRHLHKNRFKYDINIIENEELICQKRVPFSIPVFQVQLSPAERLELLSLLWLFGSKNLAKTNVSGIILLDEPDAHLHPSLVKDIIETIKSKLISKLGIQVIMTTHSPTTVSLAPEGSVYILSEDNITKEAKIEKAAKFVHVNLPFRIVFVEATDDRIFYQMIQDKLTSERLIANDYPLLFMSASRQKKRQDPSDKSGSKMIENSCRALVENIVKCCVNEEDEDQSLREFVFGLVDNDNQEDPQLYNIQCLRRYSIENYLYDPIYIYYYLRDRKKGEEIQKEINHNLSATKHPDCLSGFFGKGDTADLAKVLQEIINVITKKLVDAIEEFIKIQKKFKECLENLVLLHEDLENETGVSNKELIMKDFEETCKVVCNKGKLVEYAKKIRESTKCNDVLKELIVYARKIVKSIDKLRSNRNDLFKKREDSHDVYELIKSTENVSFGNGITSTLSYPKVILKMRGHDLVTFYTAIYPSLPKLNSEMIAFLRRCSRILIPEDLIPIFKSLQIPDIELQRQCTTRASREDAERSDTQLMKKVDRQKTQLRELQKKLDKIKKQNQALNDCLNQVEEKLNSGESQEVHTDVLHYIVNKRKKLIDEGQESNGSGDETNGHDRIVNDFST